MSYLLALVVLNVDLQFAWDDVLRLELDLEGLGSSSLAVAREDLSERTRRYEQDQGGIWGTIRMRPTFIITSGESKVLLTGLPLTKRSRLRLPSLRGVKVTSHWSFLVELILGAT